MANNSPRLHSDEIDSQSAWLRAFVLRLVQDGDAADDVVQETWLACLHKGPTDLQLRKPWLTRVALNFARQSWRRSSNRLVREIQAAASESVPSAEHHAVRAEAVELLHTALRALKQPYRSTIELIYIEGKSREEVARLHGVAPETVRWRLKVGLDEVRGRLDKVYGGDRSIWVSALCPLVIAPVLRPPRGGRVAMAIAFGGMSLGALWLWTDAGRTSGTDLAEVLLPENAPSGEQLAQRVSRVLQVPAAIETDAATDPARGTRDRREHGALSSNRPLELLSQQLKTAFGNDSPFWAEVQHDLAMKDHRKEHFASAEQHLLCALEIHEKRSGANSTRAMHVRDDLAELLIADPTRWNEAESLLRANVGFTTASGGHGREQLTTKRRLAQFFLETNRVPEASATLSDLLEATSALPAQESELLDIAILHGRVLLARGEAARALSVVAPLVPSSTSANAATAHGLLANIHHALGDPRQRLDSMIQVELACVSQNGPIDPKSLAARLGRIECEIANGNAPLARELLTPTLLDVDAHYGPVSHRAFRERVDASMWFCNVREYQDSDLLAYQALRIHAAGDFQDDARVILTLDNLAQACRSRGDLWSARAWAAYATFGFPPGNPKTERSRSHALYSAGVIAIESQRARTALVYASLLEKIAILVPDRTREIRECAARLRAMALTLR